jgi:hypothetical protein
MRRRVPAEGEESRCDTWMVDSPNVKLARFATERLLPYKLYSSAFCHSTPTGTAAGAPPRSRTACHAPAPTAAATDARFAAAANRRALALPGDARGDEASACGAFTSRERRPRRVAACITVTRLPLRVSSDASFFLFSRWLERASSSPSALRLGVRGGFVDAELSTRSSASAVRSRSRSARAASR